MVYPSAEEGGVMVYPSVEERGVMVYPSVEEGGVNTVTPPSKKQREKKEENVRSADQRISSLVEHIFFLIF
jgi:hypothetical protein